MEIYLLLFFILILAIFLGLELISKIPSTLHTPLMSGANAISGITLVGALTLQTDGTLQMVLAKTICKVPSVCNVRAPTNVMPLIAFAPDIKGVCRVLGIFEINSNPKKIANIKIKNRSRYISIT